MMMKKIAIHSKIVQWQTVGGYNDFYDWVFDKVTEMDKLKLNFTYDDNEYAVWAWKGDYINLGVGAEVGFYQWVSEINLPNGWGLDQWYPTSLRKMTLSLYKEEGYGEYTSYYHWYPDTEQWWITGFDPKHKEKIDVDELIQISSIDFSDEPEMLEALLNEYESEYSRDNLIFDEVNDLLWIVW